MTDQVVDNEVGEEGAEGEGPVPHKRWSGKRIVLFIVLPVVVLLSAGAGVYFSGLLGGHSAAEGEAAS